MSSWEDIWSAIENVFTPFKWTFVVEALLVSMLIYFVMRTLHENNAGRLNFLYIGILLLAGVIALVADSFTVEAYLFFFLLFSLFFLLLFSVEIKRNIWKGGKTIATGTAAKTKIRTHNPAAAVKADEAIGSIVKAVQTLSKNNTGALIVLSNGNLPKEIVESGVTLNANISTQLIEGIFIPKAPLHDGAMLIYGDKIQAAGCFLPLTQKDFPKDYGTRHRAGIGVTEVADVATIIVSEETGIVSTVKRGEISRYVDSEGLRRFLKDYYWKEFNAEERKS